MFVDMVLSSADLLLEDTLDWRVPHGALKIRRESGDRGASGVAGAGRPGGAIGFQERGTIFGQIRLALGKPRGKTYHVEIREQRGERGAQNRRKEYGRNGELTMRFR